MNEIVLNEPALFGPASFIGLVLAAQGKIIPEDLLPHAQNLYHYILPEEAVAENVPANIQAAIALKTIRELKLNDKTINFDVDAIINALNGVQIKLDSDGNANEEDQQRIQSAIDSQLTKHKHFGVYAGKLSHEDYQRLLASIYEHIPPAVQQNLSPHKSKGEMPLDSTVSLMPLKSLIRSLEINIKKITVPAIVDGKKWIQMVVLEQDTNNMKGLLESLDIPYQLRPFENKNPEFISRGNTFLLAADHRVGPAFFDKMDEIKRQCTAAVGIRA